MRKPGRPKRYSEEFRREAVRLAQEGEQTLAAITAGLGISRPTLREWIRAAAAVAAKPVSARGQVLSLEEENRQLRRENERLREEREILKKAAAFFAKESK